MTSATHGSRSACQSRITAASIISRSASGSAILPKLDSTRQRRASQPSTWSVTPASAEDDRRRPALAAVGGEDEHHEDRDQGQPQNRERVRELGQGSRDRARSHAERIRPWQATLTLPGFVNAHSHAFQRALRGRTEGDDFWGWRESMLDLAGGLSPDTSGRGYVEVYREMLAAGYTAVGEFHYLGLAEAARRGRGGRGGGDRARAAARGLRARRPRALPPGLARGLPRRSSRRCGRPAPASALPPTPYAPARATGSRSSGATPRAESLPLHVHADEQPREIEECLAEHGLRPIELLGGDGLPRLALDGRPRDPRRRAGARPRSPRRGARVCVCPTTEANLGDGFCPVEELSGRGIGVCIGSDSNVRIDPLEELRELEGIARRRTGRRNVLSVSRHCSPSGTTEGAAALGLDRWAEIEVDLGHRSLAGVETADVPAALVFGCAADVFTA